MTPWFTATKTFSPADGDRWRDYIAWSGLTQVRQIVSLDVLLCPRVLREVKDDSWPHIVNEDFLLDFFVDLDFLMQNVANLEPKNVLCVFRNPTGPPHAPTSADFDFLGYDLLDRAATISALTNCGGFPDVFANSELSEVGLLQCYDRAVEVQRHLREQYPDERHADCDLWAIFRLVNEHR